MNKGDRLWADDTGGIQNSSMAKSSATGGGRVVSQIGRPDLRPRISVLSEVVDGYEGKGRVAHRQCEGRGRKVSSCHKRRLGW